MVELRSTLSTHDVVFLKTQTFFDIQPQHHSSHDLPDTQSSLNLPTYAGIYQDNFSYLCSGRNLHTNKFIIRKFNPCNPSRLAVELNGLQDFDADRITVTFPQTTSTAEVVMPVTIPIINDDTNEATEGLYLLVTISTVESNPTDVANAVVLRNGVALVRIRDDDSKGY